jgi:hypothetical protein
MYAEGATPQEIKAAVPGAAESPDQLVAIQVESMGNLTADYGNREAAKKEIAKALVTRLEGNPDWQPYLDAVSGKGTQGQKELADVPVGKTFKLAGFGDNGTVVSEPFVADGKTKVMVKVPAIPKPFPLPGDTLVDSILPKPPGGYGQSFEEQATSGLVSNWAGTSSDSDVWALALQRAASQEFGLGEEGYNTALHSIRDSEIHDRIDSVYEAYGDSLRAFLRAMYEETQSRLVDAGVSDQVTLYRGQGFEHESVAAENARVEAGWTTEPVTWQPMSSFSTNLGTATNFIRGESGGLAGTVVPRSRIIGTARSGFGCLEEQEFVVLGAPPGVDDTATIRWGEQSARAATGGGPGMFWARAALNEAHPEGDYSLFYDAAGKVGRGTWSSTIEYEGKNYLVRGYTGTGKAFEVVNGKAVRETTEIPQSAVVRHLTYEEETALEEAGKAARIEEARAKVANLSVDDAFEQWKAGLLNNDEFEAVAGETAEAYAKKQGAGAWGDISPATEHQQKIDRLWKIMDSVAGKVPDDDWSAVATYLNAAQKATPGGEEYHKAVGEVAKLTSSVAHTVPGEDMNFLAEEFNSTTKAPGAPVVNPNEIGKAFNDIGAMADAGTITQQQYVSYSDALTAIEKGEAGALPIQNVLAGIEKLKGQPSSRPPARCLLPRSPTSPPRRKRSRSGRAPASMKRRCRSVSNRSTLSRRRRLVSSAWASETKR